MRNRNEKCSQCGAIGRTHGSPCIDVAPTLAADYVDLLAEVARLKAEYRDEMREAQRDCASAYAEGRLEGSGGDRW